MELTWYGLSCFRLTERGYATIITDPYNGNLGLPALKLKSDIVTVSHNASGHNSVSAVSGYKHAITGPGEYEIGGVFVTGVSTRHIDKDKHNVLYIFHYDNLSIAHLGDMAKVPTQTQIDVLEQINILLLPVGGGNGLNAAQAAELVSLLEPNIVIPMHYHLPNLQIALDGVERFLKEMGVNDVQPANSFKTTGENLPEDTEVVVLNPRI